MRHKEIGIAVIGAGRIGTRRASLAAAHSAVNFIAISDTEISCARKLAEEVGAQFHSDTNIKAISRPEVSAVIVSTSEHAHREPVLQAIALGKPVLVEKPIALSLEDADRIVAAASRAGVDVRVGYSRRFKHCYLLAKEQVARGRLGQIVGIVARAYNSRAHPLQALRRSPHATVITDALTYFVDLICWYLPGNRPVEVIARGQQGVFKAAGYDLDDVTLAILTFADGAVVSLGADFALPEKYPTFGPNARVEILGTEGVLLIDDDSKDQVLYTERGIPHSYVPGHHLNLALLNSSSSGDWVQGEFLGPLADETRAWLDHLSTGRACMLPTAGEARVTLEITLAMEEAIKSKQAIALPLAG